MNLKTTSAKLMSIILTIVMLVGMMPATMAMAEDPIYSIEAEDIELYLPADYNQNDIYALSKAEIHGKDLRTIKIKNTGNQSVHIYRDKPTLTDKSENFPDDNDYKIFVMYSSSNAYSTVNPGETKSYYYIEIDTGLAPGVYTATINIAAQTREENVNYQPGSLKVTANFKLTVGDHNWDTTSWEKNTQKHWHKCNDSGCTAKKDEAEHDSAKVEGYVAPTFDNDGSTGDKYCSVCGQKVANATTIAAGKYIRESRATMTPAAISDAICANDLVFTSTPVTGAKFALNGYAIGSKIVDITVTPDSTNTGINYLGDEFNKYGGYYIICTDAKVLEDDFSSDVKVDSTALFEKDKNYYLVVVFQTNDNYSIDDLTAAQVTLDGVAASKLVKNGSTMVAAVFTLPKLTETYTITFDANEGTVSPATATTNTDGKLTTLPEPTRSKYNFIGWFTAKTGGEQVTTSTVFTKDATVYAQWKLRSTGGGGGAIVYNTLTFATNGGSHLDSVTRTQGTTISLKDYKPTKSGYDFMGWYSDKKLTKKVTTVQLDQDTTVYAAWQENTPEPIPTEPFVDVNANDWFYDDVVYAYNNGLMGGMSANTFNPNVPTTRGMIVTILYRMENEPAINGVMPFKDVKAGSYYENAILWAVGNNIVSGYGNGMFGPDDMITREQMASILWRYAQYKGYDVSIGEDTNILSYDDALSISAYAMPALQWACGDGIIGGTTANTLSPQGQATRAQTAAILHRFCDKIGR